MYRVSAVATIFTRPVDSEELPDGARVLYVLAHGVDEPGDCEDAEHVGSTYLLPRSGAAEAVQVHTSRRPSIGAAQTPSPQELVEGRGTLVLAP